MGSESRPAISMWQPWASLWVSTPRLKWHETRNWPAPARYIGRRILVHAAKTREGILDVQDDPDLSALCAERFGPDWATTLPMGGYIGSLVLAACERMTSASVGKTPEDFLCGYWEPGRYGWLGEDPLSGPMIPARGQQGFWLVDWPLEGQGKLATSNGTTPNKDKPNERP